MLTSTVDYLQPFEELERLVAGYLPNPVPSFLLLGRSVASSLRRSVVELKLVFRRQRCPASSVFGG